MDMIKKLRFDESSDNYEEYITCPYCCRRFAPIPAEKHINACKDTINKPKPPPNKLIMLPKLNEKKMMFIKDQINVSLRKISPKNALFFNSEHNDNNSGGLNERVPIIDEHNRENSQINMMKKIKKKHLTEPRSKSIYKIQTTVCKCGEILPNRAIYCMICGNCKYR